MQVTLDQFLTIRASRGEPKPVLEDKAKAMRETYACFAPLSHTQHHPSHSKNRKPHWRDDRDVRNKTVRHDATMRTEVVKIGSRELSRENLARKDFLALTNKLTHQNKDHICKTLKNVYREDFVALYVELLWDMMQRSPDYVPLYIDILQALSHTSTKPHEWRSAIENVWKSYLENAKWLPPHDLQESEEYDEFCDFVKWKKRSIGALHALAKLSESRWIPDSVMTTIIPKITEAVTLELQANPTGSKVSDLLMDQVLHILREKNESWCALARPWAENLSANVATFRPATKFKMLDVSEACFPKLIPPKNCPKKR